MHDCHPKIIKPSQYHQSLSSVLKIILWQACWTSILLKYLIHLHFWSWGSKNWKWVSISPVFEWFRQIQFSRVGTPTGSSEAASSPPNQNPTQSWSRPRSFNLQAPLCNWISLQETHCISCPTKVLTFSYYTIKEAFLPQFGRFAPLSSLACAVKSFWHE